MARLIRTTDWPYLGLIVLFAVVIGFLWWTPFVYPLTILTTIFHEISHGLATLLTGGSLLSITINADGSGDARMIGGAGLIVAPAGYIGATIFGAVLLLTARWRRAGRAVLFFLAALLLITDIIWVRNNWFGPFVVLLLAGGFAAVAWRAPNIVVRLLNPLVAVALLRFAVDDVLGLVRFRGQTHNDAVILERLTGIPSGISAVVWMLLSLAITLVVLYVATRRRPAAPAPARIPAAGSAGLDRLDTPAAVDAPTGALSRRDLLRELESQGLLEGDKPRA